ncbi:MAG: caspase family protein, partial [Chlamydiia bacterium]|nr:caspase family protein [Chlamydiia bacterium]
MRVLFTFLFLLCTALEGATMHALLLIDTQAEELETAMAQNLKHWQRRLNEIKLYTDYTVKTTVLQGDDLRVSKITEALSKMQVKKEDAVLFYFCGHGCRTKAKEDIWPYLALSPENVLIDYMEILSYFAYLEPRVLFAMADCCNNVIDSGTSPVPKSMKKKNYRALFQDKPIWIACSSSEPGEYSWAWVGKGSCFTLEFMKALDHEVR